MSLQEISSNVFSFSWFGYVERSTPDISLTKAAAYIQLFWWMVGAVLFGMLDGVFSCRNPAGNGIEEMVGGKLIKHIQHRIHGAMEKKLISLDVLWEK